MIRHPPSAIRVSHKDVDELAALHHRLLERLQGKQQQGTSRVKGDSDAAEAIHSISAAGAAGDKHSSEHERRQHLRPEMENSDSRAWAKGSSNPQQQQQQQQQQNPGAQRGLPPASSTPSSGPAAGTPQHRYPTGPPNQLPPIQSATPMSPKTDGTSARPFIPPISHSSPASSTGLPSSAPPPQAPRPGAYPTTTLPPPAQAAQAGGGSHGAFASPGISPNPAASAPGGITTAAPTTLPSISSAYVRSPSFTSASTASIPPIKSTIQQQQPMHHPASSPLHGATVPSGPRESGSYAASQAPVSRMQAPSAVSSPGARPGPPMQSPHPQQPSSVPPLKQQQQSQSPMVHRTASAQNTPMPPIVQPSPRPQPQGATPQVSSSAAAFSAAPRVPAAAASTPVATAAPATAPQASRPVPTAAQSSAPAASSNTAQPQSTQAAASTAAKPADTAAAPAGSSGDAAQTDSNNRPLNVRDALSYLDMVKSQFQDRPEVYNQFLDIMKDFKSHAIDTPGVIERVSRLFYGSPSLIQGFNTFLPPGYRIECSDDPTEGVRVTTPSGSIIPDMQRRTGSASQGHAQMQPQSPLAAPHQPAAQRSQYQQHTASREQYIPRQAAPAAISAGGSQKHAMQPSAVAAQPGAYPGSSAPIAVAGAAPAAGQAVVGGGVPASSPTLMASPSLGSAQRTRQAPMEFNHAINYVNKIKMRFAAEPDHYKEFLEILQTYQKESRPIQEVYAQVQVLFSSAPDLLDEFKQFLPDTSEPGVGVDGPGSPGQAHVRASAGVSQVPMAQGKAGQHGMAASESVSGGRLPPVGNFTPTAGAGHVADPYAAGGVPGSGAAAGAQAAGMAYDGKAPGATPTSGRKRRTAVAGNAQVAGSGSTKRRNKGAKADAGAAIADQAAGIYGQQLAGVPAPEQPANPGTATPDELAFFERVKRFIGQPSTYNEFLKLLNLYNQQVLDAKALVERAESFIGDDQELFGWFKQFVGYDEQQQAADDTRSTDDAIIESILGPEPSSYMPPEEVAKTLRPVRPKAELSLCKSYGPSYRLLPASSMQAKCSGRDAMCYEVLNDRWASHPTWASEDTEFVHHKKNQYEEAMFRSEEDRHEMDIEIDTNLSVIRQLTPIAQQLEQMDPEKQMQLTLPEGFWGMSEALPRRALRKVYDSHRALEIIKAMHTHPAVAIPIVLKRLKQKDEEWRRQRREYAKVWRESDAKNYYRALDHQGLTFKSVDRKNISPKHLITEIETRRREQQGLAEEGGARGQNRKVASALRHRYQLEYRLTESTVIADVINAILAHVGKQNSQFMPAEKEMMEKFFHDLFGGLFGVEKPVSAPAAVDTDESDGGSEEAAAAAAASVNGKKASSKRDKQSGSNGLSNGVAAETRKPEREAAAKEAAAKDADGDAEMAETPAKEEAAVAAGKAEDTPDADKQAEPGKDAMDIDRADDTGASESAEKGAEAKEDPAVDAATASNATAAKTQVAADEGSKPSTPGLISSRSWIQLGSSSNRDVSAAPASGAALKNVSRAFYTNSSYYVFLRLFQILYERFDKLREIGPECQRKVMQAQQAQSVATKLGMRPQPEALKAYDLENTDYYTIFLELVDQFLQGQLDTSLFEEAVRVMYGINAYKILTVDKAVQAISKNIQHLVSDGRCTDILSLFTTLPPVHEQSPLRAHIAYRMKVEALVGADEHVFRIDYIYDSQTMTIQLLRREDITLDEAVTEEERWAYYVDSYVLFEPTEGVPRPQQARLRPYLPRHLHADERDYVISSRSNLEIKIAVNTYKLCFLTGTEDIYTNHTRRSVLADPAAKAAYEEQWRARAERWHQWMAREQANSSEELAEWWK
ncbi:hypothetical protein GQ54DRAFT_309772 [Martensiomyces pterosporus]|nr:hypothetical protein GQ54DRAFT_309772 [Martensiomyces pterosporus]